MAIMNFLRNRAGVIIVAVIGFAICAFLLGDVLTYGTPFWARQQNQVGSIDGNSIDYGEFRMHMDQTTEMYRQQMGGALNPAMESWISEQVWSQFISRELLNKEIENIGLGVGTSELNDLVSGENPSMQMMQYFGNPQTGQLDRAYLNEFAAQAKAQPRNSEMRMQWETILDNVVEEKLNQKFNTLISNSVYVTSLEAIEDFNQRNKLANFDYVLLDYDDVADTDVTITDNDYREFYNENKSLFVNRRETRTLEYVIFDASPVARDTALARERAEELAQQLRESTTDSLFAAVNSDTKYPFIYRKRGELTPSLDSLIFSAPVGTTVGPILTGGVFEMAKIVDARQSPDSVKASHILLNPTLEGGLVQARAKADSIKQLIQQGESMAGLAIQFSTDEGSKFNGGELGTFARGMMVPEFENAAFDGKPGDVVVVQSRFGIHIIKIERQIGSSRVVKAAIVDKQVVTGKETSDLAYNQATQFFSAINGDNFNEVATEQNLVVYRAEHVGAMERALNGVTAPRDLFRWAFDADAGEVSDQIYDGDDAYLVARVVSIRPEGQLPLEQVKADIEDQVRNRVKARMLTEKINEAAKGATDLQQIAGKLGKEPVSTENIVLANPIIPGVAQESAVVGAVFGLQPQKPSGPITGNQGVYVVQVSGFVNPTPPEDVTAQRQQMQQGLSQRIFSGVFQALQNNAKITDNRVRFF